MRWLIVEIHDVSPAEFDQVRIIQDALENIGVPQPTLLVVPALVDQDGRSWDLRQHPDIVDWLYAREKEGVEIIQHGLTHRAPCSPPPGLRNQMMHRWFSRGCAEFAHLSAQQALQRLVLGQEIFNECSLHSPRGFIAPAWQQSPAAISALRSLGYGFTAFFNKVTPLDDDDTGVEYTPALTFAAPGPLLDYGKRAVMRGLEMLAREKPLLRVAIHPADVRGRRPLGHIISRIRLLLRQRHLATYAGWLGLEPLKILPPVERSSRRLAA